MPSRKEYNLVQSDDLDSRIPLVPDEAFQHGINFNVKFIGAMDIARPCSRVEIVAAMRRVRFEFKAKGIKKRKVTVTVSTEGLRTFVRKKKPKRNKKNHMNLTSPEIIVESHPIYRIFYVSHDSQDVKIWSYIARETSSSTFHCVVFKANKKSQAMKIVRTVGQAFEVCHKISGPISMDDNERVEGSKENQLEEIIPTKKSLEETPKPTPKKIPPPINVEPEDDRSEQDMMSRHESSSPQSPKEMSNTNETKLLREKLEQATAATKAAQAQVNLLRDHLQSRTHQLLQQNRELLDHLQSLVRHIQELEGTKQQSLSSVNPTPLPQVLGPSFQEIDSLRRQNAALLETILYENNRHYPYCLYHMHSGSPGHGIPPAHSLNQLLVNPLLHHSVPPPPSSQSSSPTSKFYDMTDSFGTVFTSAGHPCEIIKPIDEGSRGGGGAMNREVKFGGSVQRSVSEKIGHRSELMTQVQRAAWSRHTTQ